MKLKTLAAAGFGAALLVTGASGVQAETKYDVTQIVATVTFAFLPVYVAQHSGYFEEEGVNLNVVTVSSSQAGLATVATGEAQYYLSTPVAGARSAAQGAPIVNCGALMTQDPSNIVLSAAAAEKVGLPEDPSTLSYDERIRMLEGLKIAAHSPGSSPDQAVRYLTRQVGMDPDRDVEILPITGRSILPAMEQGRIDAFSYSSPLADTAVIQLGARKLISLAGGGYEPLAGRLAITMVCNRDWVENETEEAAAVVRAIWRGMRLMKTDPAAAKAAARKSFPDLDDNIFDAAFETNLKAFPDNPRLSDAQLQRAIDFHHDMGGARIEVAARDTYSNKAVDLAEETMN